MELRTDRCVELEAVTLWPATSFELATQDYSPLEVRLQLHGSLELVDRVSDLASGGEHVGQQVARLGVFGRLLDRQSIVVLTVGQLALARQDSRQVLPGRQVRRIELQGLGEPLDRTLGVSQQGPRQTGVVVDLRVRSRVGYSPLENELGGCEIAAVDLEQA